MNKQQDFFLRWNTPNPEKNIGLYDDEVTKYIE